MVLGLLGIDDRDLILSLPMLRLGVQLGAGAHLDMTGWQVRFPTNHSSTASLKAASHGHRRRVALNIKCVQDES